MSQESEAQKIRAKQVGVLMKHYRSSFPVGDGRAGLTMEDVLERMAQVNQRYENSAPSTVYRWETGQTMPKKARLQEFGIALNLTQLEIDGLVALAGIDERHRPDATNGAGVVPEDLEDVPVATTGTGPLAPEGAGTFGEPAVRSFLVETLKGGIVQFLLPGLAIAAAGYLLSSLGITEAWIMMLYIGLAIGLVVFQGVLRLTRADSLRDLLFMSLFFVLSAPVMQIPFVHSDHYGFYLLSNPTDSAKLILLSLAACLSLALVASLAFDLLWRWQYSGRGAGKAHHRAIWTVAPPVAFVYLCILLFGQLGAWIQYAFVLSVFGGAFITLALLKDETVTLSEWDRRFLLWSAFMTVLVLTAIASATVLVTYTEFSLLSTKGHTLIHSWDVDYSAWGHSEQELFDRNRISYVWTATLILVYMVVVLGGALITTIYRMDTTHTDTPTADVGELSAGTTAHHNSRKERIQIPFQTGKACRQPDLFQSEVIGGSAAQSSPT